MLQGKDHLGLAQAQHKGNGVCKQLQNRWLGFQLMPEELPHKAAHASAHEANLLWEIPFNRRQAGHPTAGTKDDADVPWSSCFLHAPSPQIHCTQRAVEKPYPTSAKEKTLKSAPSCNPNILSFRATTKAVSLCLLPYQIPSSKQIPIPNRKYLFLGSNSWTVCSKSIADPCQPVLCYLCQGAPPKASHPMTAEQNIITLIYSFPTHFSGVVFKLQ